MQGVAPFAVTAAPSGLLTSTNPVNAGWLPAHSTVFSASGGIVGPARTHSAKSSDMTLIIEFDGPIIDLRSVHYQAYREVAGELGWSRLDQATFWRLIRTQGRDAAVLPGARPVKAKAFWTRFDQRVEEDRLIADYELLPGVEAALETIARHGRYSLVSIGSNIAARRRLAAEMRLAIARMEPLDVDPRRRPGQLRVLAGGDQRDLVVAGTDALARSAGQANLVTAGISSGSCTAERLHRAGADIVYSGLGELAESLQSGAKELIQAGLLPPPLG